jgi:hypothetical protein
MSEEETPLILLAKTCGGLSNTIKNCLGCIRIQRHFQQHTCIVDNENKLRELFDFPPEYYYSNAIEDGTTSRIEYIYDRMDWRFAIFNTDKNLDKIINDPYSLRFPDFKEYRFFSNYQNNAIDTVYRADLFHEIYQEYSDIFKSIPLKPSILKKITDFSETYFNKNTISVHLRSWIDYQPRAVDFRFEDFCKKIEELDDGRNTFFVSSDEPTLSLEIQSRFGCEKIILYHSSSASDNDETPLEKSFIELMLLSKNQMIIGTELSTFTEMAYIIDYHREKEIILL